MTETGAVQPKDVLGAEVKAHQASSSLTIVRIKRRRDDPAEPEIILEAAGAYRNKQPRYDEILLQFQGLSVMGAPTASTAAAPRRRFRRLQTLDATVLEAMSESELVRFLRCQPVALVAPSSAPAAPAVHVSSGAAGASAGSSQPQQELRPQPPVVLQDPVPAGVDHRGSGQPRRAVKGSSGPSTETRIAALRMSHQQAATAARYKQIRRKRDSTMGEGTEADGLHMYDLERLPAAVDRRAPDVMEPVAASGRRRGTARSQRPLPAPATRQEEHGQQQQLPGQRPEIPALQQQPSGFASDLTEQDQRRRQHEQQQQQRAEASAPGAASSSADEALIQRYAPLVDEVLRSLGQDQQQQGVRRIPARPRKAQQIAAAAAAAAAVRPLSASAAAAVEGQPRPQPQPHAGPQLTHAAQQAPTSPTGSAHAPAGTFAAGAAVTCTSVASPVLVGDELGAAQDVRPASTQLAAGGGGGARAHGERAVGDDEHTFVYDVYVPVHGDADGGSEDGAEEPWPWLDAPADMAVPVIEVAENDDELFWGGQLETEAAQRAAEAEEHDSEDSNAESYYANTYPDEEDAPYGPCGNDAGSDDYDDGDELDEAEPPDADVGGGYGWGSAMAMRRRGPSSDDDDDDEDGDEGDEDEEIFGRRSRRVRPAKVSSYYRTENDDYSEHSSFLSEEEERREAEERRRRLIFMH